MKCGSPSTTGLIVPHEAMVISDLLKVLQHPIRLMIVCELLERELYAGEITECFGTTKGNISQHLTLLLEHKIIDRESRGNKNIYRISDHRIESLIRVLKKNFCPHGPSRPVAQAKPTLQKTPPTKSKRTKE